MRKAPVYMDGHATTPVDPRVVEAMLPYFTERFGNASSRTHAFGWQADAAVVLARKQVASLIGARGREIVFTSGATESNNLALRGAAARYRDRGTHLVTLVTEHEAVLDTCRRLEADGFSVTYLPVRSDGLIDLETLRAAITERTILVSVMAANNEIGVLQPLAEVGRIAKAVGALFHTDAAQAAGKVPFLVNDTGVDLVSLSSHKLYGPKGVGALYVRRRPRVELQPLLDGGGQEERLRPGTLNVPGIVGFGQAAELCRLGMNAEASHLARLRDRLWLGLSERLDGIQLNGSMTDRLPHNLNVSIAGVDGEPLMLGLEDVAVSAGSACASASLEPSHVLRAIGASDQMARASLRFGLGRFNSQEDVDHVVERVAQVVSRLREMSPLETSPLEDAELSAPSAPGASASETSAKEMARQHG